MFQLTKLWQYGFLRNRSMYSRHVAQTHHCKRADLRVRSVVHKIEKRIL